ncbi:hypothetical protein Goshw_028683, partial [Gossypium schwendimanii]|nr:hypothetical protein [Gossypium schwendimanii]
MVVEPQPMPPVSWKDMLVGKETIDVKKSFVDGVPSIDFSERVYQLLEKEMSTSMVLKMLGRNLGKVTKLDFNTDSRPRGRYARMAFYVNLGRPLISKILINGNPQRIEYKNLHVKGKTSEITSVILVVAREGDYGPWMLVERKTRRDTLDGIKKGNNIKGEKNMGSRYQSLIDLEMIATEEEMNKETQRVLKKKGKAILISPQEKSSMGKKFANDGSKKFNLGLS